MPQMLGVASAQVPRLFQPSVGQLLSVDSDSQPLRGLLDSIGREEGIRLVYLNRERP